MPENNAAAPLPEPNANTNTPNLSVVPDASAPTVSRGEYNREIEVELTKASQICLVAQKQNHAQRLEQRGINAGFVTALLVDIEKAGQKSQHAVACDAAGAHATQTGGAAAQTLVDSLQTIQSAARVQFLPENPAKLDTYLVGRPLAESRPLLERHSQAIIDAANTERPAGLDTNFIERVQSERRDFVNTAATQGGEESRGKQDRAERDALVKSIVARRKKIQYAADSQWPPRKTESVQARKDFQLPQNRPYSY